VHPLEAMRQRGSRRWKHSNHRAYIAYDRQEDQLESDQSGGKKKGPVANISTGLRALTICSVLPGCIVY
jgi:hypothetical protein